MIHCNGTTHSWSDDSYSYGSYPCPGPEKCADARARLQAEVQKAKKSNKLMDEAKDKKPKVDKAKQAKALREKAEKLEAEAKNDAIRERCSYQGVEWNQRGEAKAVYTEFVPCPGTSQYPHQKTYNDEYGSRVSCSVCNGNNQIFTRHYIRVPEYDAPKPPKEPV